MPLAVIQTGGKQYLVSEGTKLLVEKLPGEKGASVTFDTVLLFDDGKKTDVGMPYLAGKKVMGTILETGKGKKILILKYKSKVRYRVKRGHRQPFTKVEITKIS